MRGFLEVDPINALVIYRAERLGTADSFARLLQAIISHPDHQQGFGGLFDYRRVTETPDVSLIRCWARQVALVSDQLGRCRWGAVAPSLAFFGLLRMAATLFRGTNVELHPFYAIRPAKKWLGVKDDACGRLIAV